MRDGLLKVAAVTPKVTVCDVTSNVREIKDHMHKCHELGAKITVFPELCLTGYSCHDMFYQELLLTKAMDGLLMIAEESKALDGIYFVGLPFVYRGKLYNVAAAVANGEILGLVPKRNLPNYNEFYEARQFTPGVYEPVEVELPDGSICPFGMNQLFTSPDMPELVIGVELCEDLWTPSPPSIDHALNGANVIVNLSASNEVTGKNQYRRELVATQSARLYAGYIYASAGPEESTQDLVYSGHNLIAESGRILEESRLFSEGAILSELDISFINHRRRTMTTYEMKDDPSYIWHEFPLDVTETYVTRFIDPRPFVPSSKELLDKRCEEILDIQSHGLRKRLSHTHASSAVIGISGGLDSTLALLVTVRAFDMLSMDRKGILAVTMPGFGTTDRTYQNAIHMIEELGVTLSEISIKESVLTHFRDIGQDPENHDVTYENGQARMRTQILMNLANKNGGLVVGTGDMSELALGWATYNGDHMSMYGVNASVPKTLVRYLVQYYADALAGDKLKEVLYDVLSTPVSPELLPPKDGVISQKTEELVGPYELHDFFLYYLMRYGAMPRKVYRLACIAFDGVYDQETILKWLKIFYRRFFAQQFKRSCLPDGPKVGTVSLSPRGDLRMPSDASSSIFLEQLEEL